MRYQRIDRVRKQQSHTFPIRDLRSLRGSMTTFPVVGESTFSILSPEWMLQLQSVKQDVSGLRCTGLAEGFHSREIIRTVRHPQSLERRIELGCNALERPQELSESHSEFLNLINIARLKDCS